MKNIELIREERKLTKEEYKQLFNYLLKDETVKFKWEEPFIIYYLDKLIMKLRFLTKSSKMTSSWCKQQLKYERILFIRGYEDEKYLNELLCDTKRPMINENDMNFIIPTIGANCHFINDKIWDNIDVEKVKKYKYLEEISDYFYVKCLEFIPEDEIAKSVYQYFFRQYSDYEANRIMEIINDIGRESCNKYIIPTYREVKIENYSQYKSGVIDVIHRMVDDTYAITDYKYGRPHYYYGSKWDKKGIDTEIGEYFSLLQGEAYRVVNENELVPIEDLIIENGRILYLRDWRNTYQYIKITHEMLKEEQKLEADIIDCINNGKFKRRITQYCMLYCVYQRICEKSSEWRNKWNKINNTLKIEDFNL